MADEPLTITAAAALLRTGDLTPSELLEQCLRRIDVYEPAVQAWVYLDRERARRDAAEMTEAIRKGGYRGPLHGIPIGVKDIIDVFDMPTGCGSKLWANSYARRDATVVERLRAAGALILGKTVTTPYAFTDPPKTRNPWNLSRTPGGSSSGSAAAVACGMCLGALGTQTGGSLTRPASYCGVCSLKPTYNRVSVEGVLPLAPSLDHVGVMANCVRDLAVIYEVVAGLDPLDRRYKNDPEPIPACVSFVDQHLPNPVLNPIVFGGLFDRVGERMAEAYGNAIRLLESEHTEYERCVPPPWFANLPAAHRRVMAVEAAEFHEERLGSHPDDYPCNIRNLIEDGIAGRGTDFIRAWNLQRDSTPEVSESLRHIHTYITPATADFPPTREGTGDPALNVPWSFCRVPTVSVPAGASVDGLPFAVQLVGGKHEEARLLATAAWCESVFDLPRHLPPVPA